MSDGDRGVAGERTALSWERTALAIMCGSVIITRLTYGRLGPGALLCLAVALPLAAAVLLEGRSRHSRDARLHGGSRRRGGRSPAALALATLALASAELAAVVH